MGKHLLLGGASPKGEPRPDSLGEEVTQCHGEEGAP